MKCEQVKEHIAGYEDGNLSPDLMLSIRLHLEECEECANLLKGLEQYHKVMSIARQDTISDPNLTAEIFEKVDEWKNRESWFSRLWNGKYTQRVAYFAATAAVCLTVGFFVKDIINIDSSGSANLNVAEADTSLVQEGQIHPPSDNEQILKSPPIMKPNSMASFSESPGYQPAPSYINNDFVFSSYEFNLNNNTVLTSHGDDAAQHYMVINDINDLQKVFADIVEDIGDQNINNNREYARQCYQFIVDNDMGNDIGRVEEKLSQIVSSGN